MTGLSASLMEELAEKANSVVEQILLQGCPPMISVPKTEVGLVAALTLGGVPGIASVWRQLLGTNGYSLKMQGVFCHAAPVVDYDDNGGKSHGCELADLLIVTDFKNQNGTTNRQASLIQAKLASGVRSISLTSPSSATQLYLYQNWPSFEFRDAIYPRGPYSLVTQASGEAGSLGIIDRHYKNSPSNLPKWTQHNPTPTPVRVTHEPRLGDFLVGMINSSPNFYGRMAVPGGKDDWSKVVDLLLTITYQKAFRHSPTLEEYSPARGVTAVAFLAGSEVSNPSFSVSRLVANKQDSYRIHRGVADPPFYEFDYVEVENPAGISLVRIEIEKMG